MARISAALLVAMLGLPGCGPRRRCSGPHPDFVVTLELSTRPLPPDTVVYVTYGGSGTESYDLAHPSADPEVVFCSPVSKDGAGAVGANGAAGATSDDTPSVDALSCELWTGGFTTVQVQGTGLGDDLPYQLSPNDDQCTVRQTIVLDSPDGG